MYRGRVNYTQKPYSTLVDYKSKSKTKFSCTLNNDQVNVNGTVRKTRTMNFHCVCLCTMHIDAAVAQTQSEIRLIVAHRGYTIGYKYVHIKFNGLRARIERYAVLRTNNECGEKQRRRRRKSKLKTNEAKCVVIYPNEIKMKCETITMLCCVLAIRIVTGCLLAFNQCFGCQFSA